MKELKFKICLVGMLYACHLLFCSCEKACVKAYGGSGTAAAPEEVLAAFRSRYPDAGEIVWSQILPFYMVDFIQYSNRNQAWFDEEGDWMQCCRDIPVEELEEPVLEAFSTCSYGDCMIFDAHILERCGMETVYLIGLSGAEGLHLYFSRYGHLFKARAGQLHADMPVRLDSKLTDAVERLFHNALILDVWSEAPGIQVGILDGMEYKLIAFDDDCRWLSHVWQIDESAVPEAVQNGFEASIYGHCKVNRYSMQVNRNGSFYLIYFRYGSSRKIMKLTPDGKILYVLSYG
ncbi:MAG: PepSY-like domain-containing protein [Tannerella sp.]|jgi:hypothetical protein|nr:PepSY-like domain-containing protein [Tannerella sp.]